MAEKSGRAVRTNQATVACRRLGKFSRQVESLARRAVAIAEQAPDRAVVFLGDALGLRVDDAVARVHELDLAEHELARAADYDQALELALEARRGLRDARMLHGERRHRREPGLAELAHILRKFLAGKVHRVRRVLVDEVHDELLRAPDVLQRMLDLAVAPRIDADHAEWRVLGEHIEEGERRAVREA